MVPSTVFKKDRQVGSKLIQKNVETQHLVLISEMQYIAVIARFLNHPRVAVLP